MSYEAASDLPFRILNAYYEQTPLFLTRHHIDSYEHFVFNEMPRLIHSMNPITILKDPLAPEQGIYSYKTEIYMGGKVDSPSDLKLEIGAPIVTLDGGKTVRRMFPNEARLRGLTYSSQIRMNIDIFITRTTKVGEEFKSVLTTLNFKNFNLLKLPILLRSKLCSIGEQSSENSMVQKGESPMEHGGYFIIDGAEKLLITREEQAFNSLYVARKAPTDLETAVYATVICQHPETKMNRRCSVYMSRDDNILRVSVPSVRGMIPVFVLFRALGVESDQDIVRLIFPDADSDFTKRYEEMLIPSIEDAWPITTQAMAISFISTLTHQGSVASVLDIIRNHLFSHVPNMPRARAYYLADIVNKIIKSNAKLLANTDRDDIRNQRLLTTGTLLRDLFAAVWKDWTKAIGLQVDKTYNYNKTVYADEKFQDMFAPGNITTIFNVEALNVALMKGFRGRWGTNPQNTKTGVLQPVGRISYYDAMSHCRRILLDFDTSIKQKGPRHLHPSQIGYFCTNETPTGAHIGVSKNYSMMTYVSLAAPMGPILNWLETRGRMINIAKADSILRSIGTRIKVNGGVVGFSDQPLALVRTLKLLKWTACLAPLSSISFNTTEREISIYIDEGRPVRPLWHLSNDSENRWPQMATYIIQNPNFIPSWRDLVLGSLELTKNRRISDVDFIDPLADKPDATLEDYIKLLTPYASAIEYVDPYEINESYVSWWGAKDLNNQHTHIEIHPSTMMGLMVSLIPFANHNQSPRNQLSCSQSKQGIGYYANNYLQRYDTYGSQLCYGEAPLVRTLVFDHLGGGRVPYGFNCTVAMASTDGYNQDDGILFNKSSVERGMFRSLSLRSYEALEEIDSISKVEYKIAHPKLISAWTDLKSGYDYSKLDESGIIKEGEMIEDHTILVGRYLENPETHSIKDSSIIPTVFTKGRVESVVILHQANGLRLVRIRILQERIPELGDKFGSRHGQKGTMGMIIPAENMPHTTSGIIPDVIVNPHGLTSRMTVAQLIECLFGKMGLEVAAKCNGTSFFNRENIVKTVGESLMSMGMHPHAENIMYCGTTGKQLPCSIFMGPLYFMRMKHLTSDKMNSRGEGRREIRTHQPTGGRGNEGGMRIGEMERDAVSAHGVSLFLQESMMKRSDATNFWICNGCGTIPIYNEKEKLFVCPMCDGPVEFSGTTVETLSLIQPLRRSRVTFSKVEMPYSLKLLEQEITTYTGCGLRFITEKSVGRLRDSVLDWNNKQKEDESGEEEEQEQEQEQKQVGGGSPPPPQRYIDQVNKSMTIQPTKTSFPTEEELAQMPQGGSFVEEHAQALAGGSLSYADAKGDEPFVLANPYVFPGLSQENINKTPDASNPYKDVSAALTKNAGIQIPAIMWGGSAPYLEALSEKQTFLTEGQDCGQYSMGSTRSPEVKQEGGNGEQASYQNPKPNLKPLTQVDYLNQYSMGGQGEKVASQVGGHGEQASYQNPKPNLKPLTQVDYLNQYSMGGQGEKVASQVGGNQEQASYQNPKPNLKPLTQVDYLNQYSMGGEGEKVASQVGGTAPYKPEANPRFTTEVEFLHKYTSQGGSAPAAYTGCQPAIVGQYADGVSNKGQQAPADFNKPSPNVTDKPDEKISPPIENAGFKQRANTLKGGNAVAATAAPVTHVDFAAHPLIRSTDGYTHKGQLATVNFIDPISQYQGVGGANNTDVKPFELNSVASVNYKDPTPIMPVSAYEVQKGGSAPIDFQATQVKLSDSPYNYKIGGAAQVNYTDPTPELPRSAYSVQKGGAAPGAPVNSIGKNAVPVRHELEETWAQPLIWQKGMPQEERPAVNIPFKGGAAAGAPVNSVGKNAVPVRHQLEETWAQPLIWQKGMPQEERPAVNIPFKGGAAAGAPVNSVGKNAVPVRHQLEETWAQPQIWQKGMPQEERPAVNIAFKGGSMELTNGAEYPAPITETLGTDINQATFSSPSLGQEPFVVANPYVSPAMYQKEIDAVIPNQNGLPQTGSHLLQPVSTDLVSEVQNTVMQGGSSSKKGAKKVVNVFENSEIRVVKLM